MNYRQAMVLLNRRGNEVQGIHLGLHRMNGIMQALGNPHAGYPSLHIAGTNGKGSVAAMAESILRHSGYRTGLYTSPHLVRIEERIRVSGRDISPRCLARLAAEIRRKEQGLLRRKLLDRPLTYFEFITACAFLHFAERRVEIAVIEVGLGGAQDATNIISPRACVITGVSYDHQNILGETLAKIAGEKAGIIKPGVPVISGCRAPAARRVVLRKALDVDAPLYEIGRDCNIRLHEERRGRFLIDLQTPRRCYRRLRLSLAGKHQAGNAALAVLALEAFLGCPLNTGAARRGLKNTAWPGRLDEYRSRRRTLLDGAHNPEGAELLRDFLRRLRAKSIHLVFAALRDKDIRRIGSSLFPLADVIHLAPLSNSRTASPGDIAALHKRYRSRMLQYASSREALRSAWETCPRRGIVVATGSLYLIGELLPLVRAVTRG